VSQAQAQVALSDLVLGQARTKGPRRVIPNDQGLDLFNEYEVNFGNQVIAIFYETQLQLATKPNP
jgi:hypothetical protein